MKAALIDPSNNFSISDVVPPVIEGSPLTSIPGSATPPLSRTPPPPQLQLGSVAAADPLAQPDNHGIDMQREGSKELISVSLLLQDRRFNPVQKSAVRICIDVDAREAEDREKHISARDVIRHLQCSHSALNGPAKLGTPYRPDPSYIEYFVQFADTNDWENCKIHPEVLSIESHKLEIIIDNVSGPTSVTEGGSRMGNPEPSPRHSKPSKSEAMTTWLKEKASAMEGYSLFVGSRHRVCQNAEVVVIWKFVSNFHKIYYNAKNPISQTLVKKNALYAALDVHETWFNEALSGNRLVEVYGHGGPLEDSKVVLELAASRNPPRGRSAC